MTDVVNEWFKRHYPKNLQPEDFEYGSGGRFGGFRYQPNGNRGLGERVSTIFPLMVCADGFSLSVQGHYGAYSFPGDDFAAEGYTLVEVMLDERAEELTEWESADLGDSIIYAYVPVPVVNSLVQKHGGLKESKE